MARKPKASTTKERVVDGNSSTRSQVADLAPPGAGALERNVLDEILTLQLLVATPATMYTALAATLEWVRKPPFEFIVVDEAQDVSIAQLLMFSAMGRHRSDALFFAGDTGQRIFQQPFTVCPPDREPLRARDDFGDDSTRRTTSSTAELHKITVPRANLRRETAFGIRTS